MARIVVAGTTESLAGQALADRVAARVQADGHEAHLLGATPLPEVREADAVVCLLDGAVPPPAAVAAAATAHALGKPALALHTHPLGDALATLFTQSSAIRSEDDVPAPLAAFYAQVRPHAGRLVRDQVPRLVREAGHAVRFREATPEERPRYLKRKVAEEAQELLAAAPGEEAEEAADLLEALEALLAARGIDRERLRQAKEAKRRQRGGFERGYVVEAAGGGTGGEGLAAEAADGRPGEPAAGPVPLPALGSWPTAEAAAPEAAHEAPAPAPAPARAPSFADDPSLPLFPSRDAIRAAASAAPPAAPPGRRVGLWNVGAGGRREAIPDPEPEDPERIEPALRDL